MAKSLDPPGLHRPSDGGLEVILDWIEFTVHNYTLSDTIMHLLELKEESFMKIPGGKNGYKHQKIWNEGNIFILYNDEAYLIIIDECMNLHIFLH